MKNFELYRHNLEAYEDIVNAFEDDQRVVSIVQATGTGKTFIAINLAKNVFPKKMLFVAPTIAIIEHVQGIIAEYGLTDKVDIKFATYQSFVNKSKNDLESMEFDYLVVDEFHHTGAPIWGQRITDLINSHEDAYVLGMSAYTVRDKGTRYAMDVAPTIVQKMTDENIDESEELPIFADSIVHRYDLADALIDGTLKEPQYKYSKIKLYDYAKSLQEKVENGNLTKEEKAKYKLELDSIMSNLISSNDVQQTLKQNVKPNSKCIYFVPIGRTDDVRNIENAKLELEKIFPDAVIYSTTSDDQMGPANREAFYKNVDLDGNDVSGKLRIMVAINQYNEGVHAEGVDTVIMGRATQSDIVFYEQLGRALSVTNSSTPLCIDLSGNLDFILDLSEEIGDRLKTRYDQTGERPYLNRQSPTFSFGISLEDNNLLSRLQKIEDKTENWLVRFEQLKNYLEENNGKYPSSTARDEETKKLGIWAIKQRKAYKNKTLSNDRIEKLNSINFAWRTTLTWEESFELLKTFLKEHNGKYPSPSAQDKETKRLGEWVKTQRTTIKKGKISEDKYEKLMSVNIFVDNADIIWEESFELLKTYLKEHNGKYPSMESLDKDTKKLGKWVDNQKRSYKNKTLSKDRIEKLNSINFAWRTTLTWEESFELLKIYLKEHNGKYPSRYSQDEESKKLGKWVDTQRTYYKNKTLNKDRIEKLNSINFDWIATLTWEENFELLKNYLKENNCKYPSQHSQDKETKRLSEWVSRQRASYKNKTLSEDRIEKLSSINFNWSTITLTWEENFELLKIYLKEHNGKFPSQYSQDEETRHLGLWVCKQRQAIKIGTISKKETKDRYDKLMSINILVTNTDINWEENFKLLKTYLKEHNSKYPSRYSQDEETKKLGLWVDTQRTSYKNKTLNKDRIEKLMSINFNWSATLTWEENFELLKIYLKEHNGKYPSSTTQDEETRRLGVWVSNQRTLYKNKTLSEDRIEKLKSINFKISAKDDNFTSGD